MFASLPDIVQEILHEPFMWLDDKLKMLAGNPQELLDAGARYQDLSAAVLHLVQADRVDVRAVSASWSGQAYQGFAVHMDGVDAALDALAKNLAMMPQLLQSGAQACIEGANMIVEIVTSLLSFALGTLAVSAALSLITAGASLAVEAATVLARATSDLAKVMRVVEEVSNALLKIRSIILKIREALVEVEAFFKNQQATLKALNAATKGTKGPAWAQAKIRFGAYKTLVSKEISVVTGGAVAIPGGVGPLVHGGLDYVHGSGAATAAEASDG